MKESMENNRKSITFLSRKTDVTVGRHIWKGLNNYTKEHDINLYCFVRQIQGKDPASVLYQVIDAGRYNGIAIRVSTAGDDTIFIL